MTTTAFEDGAVIPDKFTQASQNAVSPELKWSQVPMGTQSFVLLMHDPEPVLNKSSKTDILHWLVWNIPATSTGLPEGYQQGEQSDGTRQLSLRGAGYMGRAPDRVRTITTRSNSMRSIPSWKSPSPLKVPMRRTSGRRCSMRWMAMFLGSSYCGTIPSLDSNSRVDLSSGFGKNVKLQDSCSSGSRIEISNLSCRNLAISHFPRIHSSFPLESTVLILSATLLLSAFLLFMCQPMVGKMLLPYLGGAAGVWTTCVLFFQIMLLFGYVYAHLLARVADVKKQVVTHAVVLCCLWRFFRFTLNPPHRKRLP
jgi:hypothetical protein